MSERNRSSGPTLLEVFAICVVIIGVVVLIFATGRTAGVDIGRDQVSALEHYEQAKKTAIAACVTTDPAALRQCMVEAIDSAQDQSESRQDLYAQQDMSQWAFWMMITSGLMLLISGLGVVWIKSTLDQTREAVRAADEAVEATREIGEAQLRAYITAKLEWETVIEKEGTFRGRPKIKARFVVENTGNTPAIKIIHHRLFRTLPVRLQPDTDLSQFFEAVPIEFTLGAGQISGGKFSTLTRFKLRQS